MTGIAEEGILLLSLLGKFPTKALRFLSPVIRRKREQRKEDRDKVPKFPPKLPMISSLKKEKLKAKEFPLWGWRCRNTGTKSPKGKWTHSHTPSHHPALVPTGSVKDLVMPDGKKANTSAS